MVSKRGGETVRPVMAIRSEENSCPGFSFNSSARARNSFSSSAALNCSRFNKLLGLLIGEIGQLMIDPFDNQIDRGIFQMFLIEEEHQIRDFGQRFGPFLDQRYDTAGYILRPEVVRSQAAGLFPRKGMTRLT